MNLENLEKLAQWLEDGAPHAVFHMAYGHTIVSEAIKDRDADAYTVEVRREEAGLGDCGTVCCIAGAAVWLDNPTNRDLYWEEVEDRALNILGLPKDPNNALGHPLFDNSLAPDQCTPQEAAVAVRRVMEGLDPWT